ncbi:hypothetical membrane protein [Pelotomaculum thermopropionicum SI]|uniref:Hypothetical membrane protein n=1 Tax=Pelotomaculum thermopropionicum (strain DSM 13744 / JCM 10971 / SI) TaxID=370438 RepID=A5D497_PELTS|nr:hypothetical membrane protein [Pelotomaculum thermopropionicum SI]
MLEYLAMLLAVNLILIALFQVARKRIPLNPLVIYGTVIISFILEAIFPLVISNFTVGKAAGIYLGLIVFSAVALIYVEGRVSLKINTAPAKVTEQETRNNLITGEKTEETDVHGTELTTTFLNQVSPAGAEEVSAPVAEHPASGEDPSAAGTLQETEETTYGEPERPHAAGMPALSEEMAGRPVPAADRAFDAAPEADMPPVGAEEAPVEGHVLSDEEPALKFLQEPEGAPAGPGELQAADESLGPEGLPEEPVPAADRAFEAAPEADMPPVGAEDERVAATYAALEETIKDCITSGFAAKAEGRLEAALGCFLKALRLTKSQQVLLLLAMEICAVYRELGQYRQARMFINAILKHENLINSFDLKQKLRSQLVYLDTLVEILEVARIPDAPYSKIPNFIKIKASNDAFIKLEKFKKEAG